MPGCARGSNASKHYHRKSKRAYAKPFEIFAHYRAMSGAPYARNGANHQRSDVDYARNVDSVGARGVINLARKFTARHIDEFAREAFDLQIIQHELPAGFYRSDRKPPA